jgi:signal transduction histidine kinase
LDPQTAPPKVEAGIGKPKLSRQLPWVGFGLSLFVLILIAAAADRVTTHLESDEDWVSHSQNIERLLGRLRGDMLASETGRLLYMVTGDKQLLTRYDDLSRRIPGDIDELKSMTTDNPLQQQRLDALRAAVNRRTGSLNELIALRESHGDPAKQAADLAMASKFSDEAIAIVRQMRADEDDLLKQGQTVSKRTYNTVRLILAAVFAAVVAVLALTFGRLFVALRERMEAEESVRKLNARILQLQDTERRKVARELHDSIGQVFAAMKMNIAVLTGNYSSITPEKKSALFAELHTLLEMGITETRTLSHLLHPPLLDELGFSSAAHWLVDGFSKRSNIEVSLDIPKGIGRLPQEVELVLFRVLQESLANIHRHSGSPRANIEVRHQKRKVILSVRDYGSGIPRATLEHFQKTSGGLGVGLAGMRERVAELGGDMELFSDSAGTLLRVTLPLAPSSELPLPLLKKEPAPQESQIEIP